VRLPYLALFLIAATIACGGGSHVEPPEPVVPGSFTAHNVVLVVIDTLRPDVLGCYGDPRGLSPNIDALAAEGVVFEPALRPSPITAPSHASLFTSRLPSETGLRNNGSGAIPEAMPMLAELLQARGYATAAAVAMAPLKPRWGFDRGFASYDCRLGPSWVLPGDEVVDRALALLDELEPPFFLWTHLADPHEPYDAHGVVERVAEVVVGGTTVATIPTSTFTPTTLAIDLPSRHAELVVRSAEPFVVRGLLVQRQGVFRNRARPSLHPSQPPPDPVTEYRVEIHSPVTRKVRVTLELTDVIDSREDRWQRYGREIAFVDHQIGALLDRLRRRGMYDHTLVVFTSDHGEALGCHDHIGHVDYLYDCLVRVPLVIKPPGGPGAAARRRGDPGALVDVVPTVLGALGLRPPDGLPGRDLLAPGADLQNAEVFLETHPPQAERTLYGLSDGRHKIVWTPDQDTWEFFDLGADPGELSNLFDPDNGKVQTWQHRLRQRLAALATRPEDHASPIDPETRKELEAMGYL